jgi:signal peptidase I
MSDPIPSVSPRPRWWRRFVSVAGVVAMLAVVVLLLPASLGGRIGLSIVDGTSMVPTYHSGDLVVTERFTTPTRGDVIVYRVPDGQAGAGAHVIHRIVGGDATHGFVTKGDHRKSVDPWHPKAGDVTGHVLFVVPGGGHLLRLVFNLRNIGLVTVLLLAWALWPRHEERGTDDRADERAEQDVEVEPEPEREPEPEPVLV